MEIDDWNGSEVPSGERPTNNPHPLSDAMKHTMKQILSPTDQRHFSHTNIAISRSDRTMVRTLIRVLSLWMFVLLAYNIALECIRSTVV